ncbi:uncharacterized protein FMAN_06222 [Fusarium mangiferae]|uniref:Uncharacterized protein n=1 Tax=Fusarium mangiferae TaxID=192010 RepID=A0A1L7SVM2_FUSMA|nr:uncharacterized protein FMAN_06222 [Fusarium mangiferae]CVK86507.1 uncharacterized protein FMAN_06222 [Fusarium mangiferae]
MSKPPQTHDMMIVFDAETGRAAGVTELKKAITDIINFVSVADCFDRIGVLAYRNYDYADEKVIEWSGWCRPSSRSSPLSADQLLKFVEDLEMPTVGSASKSNCASKAALANAYLQMRSNGTVVLLYAHAPPMLGLEDISGPYYRAEQEFLPKKYGKLGDCFKNWINCANGLAGTARVASGLKKAVVFSFTLGSAHNLNDDTSYWSPYLYLSAVTQGNLFRTIYSRRVIFRLTIGLLLFWMRADGNIDIPESIRISYTFDPDLLYTVSEANLATLCGSNYSNITPTKPTMLHNEIPLLLHGDVITHQKQANKLTSRNVAREYINGTALYKDFIAKHLNRIIKTNVSGIAFHPLYGQLFRTVCEKQTGDKVKTALLQEFRAQVNLIADDKDKRQTQNWLEESYTLFHEINEKISALPAHLQFPLVYIPPDQDDSGLTRIQLLSMWESCDMDTLKPLGDILSQVHYVKEEKDMPDNKSRLWPCLAPRIPLALMGNKDPGKF